MDSKAFQRLIIGLPTLLVCFFLIYSDAKGIIDITKVGYAALGSWITLILQFYFRKAGTTNAKKE